MIKDIVMAEAKKFEDYLWGFFDSKKAVYPIELFDAMKYSVFGKGKRIRPTILNLCADFVDVNRKKVEKFAVALELIHSYSLIHDDLPCMDDDEYRRGKPTCHKIYGEALALLAGDALLNLAYEVLFDAVSNDNKLFVSAVLLANYAGAEGMIGGQVQDILMKEVSQENVISMCEKKTGRLIKAAVLIPAYLHINEPIYEDLANFGSKLGLIFQLTDDLLDRSKQEKHSFVMVAGEEQTLTLIKQLNEQIHAILEKYGTRAKYLLQLADYITTRTN